MKFAIGRFTALATVVGLTGCGAWGPGRSYNINVSFEAPKSLARGQTAKTQCSVWGAEGGRLTASWYTGGVHVDIKAPDGITATPGQLDLEMKRGDLRNRATADIAITALPQAPLGKHTITITATKADGTGTTEATVEIEIVEAVKDVARP